jgi:hypothetical protein
MSLTMLDLNSEARGLAPAYSSVPPSPLPRIWIGFVLAFGVLVAEVVEVMQGNEAAVGPFTIVAAIAGWTYWLFCVHRFHRILGQLSPHVGGEPTYPITPRQAVGYHFIPVYGLFWFFKWTRELKDFIEVHTSVKMASAVLLGGLLLLSGLVVRVIDGFIGLTLLFAGTLYISRQLRRAIAEHETLRETASAFA